MEKPKKCISPEKAEKLQAYWCDTRGKLIEKGCGYVDCREFWYSIEELEGYISYVKKEAKKLKYKKKNLGIRIYLGAYQPTEDKHDGLATIFLAPTVRKKAGSRGKDEIGDDDNDQENIDGIDPFNDNQGGWPPIDYP